MSPNYERGIRAAVAAFLAARSERLGRAVSSGFAAVYRRWATGKSPKPGKKKGTKP